jgi:hypothetical protein
VSAGQRVCIEAKPIVQDTNWKMRKAGVSGSATFTWDLSSARTAHVKKDTLGIIARTCADADRDQDIYLPVRAGRPAAKGTPYRLVFLFPRRLTTINLEVFQGDGASRRVIALPDGAVSFDTDAKAPTVTVDVPSMNLDPGLVHLKMSAQGPGRFDAEQLAFLHAPPVSK